jgi:DNA polymerase alpha subunit A
MPAQLLPVRLPPLPPLQERFTDVKAEVRALLVRAGVKSMRMVPVKRNYAFELPDVPAGEQWVLKVMDGGGRQRGWS